MSRNVTGVKKPVFREGERLPSQVELLAFEKYELEMYGYATGFDASNRNDYHWLRGYRFALEQTP